MCKNMLAHCGGLDSAEKVMLTAVGRTAVGRQTKRSSPVPQQRNQSVAFSSFDKMTAVNAPQLVYELLVLDCEWVGTKRKLFLPIVNLASQPGGKII